MVGSPRKALQPRTVAFGWVPNPAMTALGPDDAAANMVERGWSRGRERQLWRFLARSLPSGRVVLAGRAAVATITFDDVPESAASIGAPLLERRGLRGTFYVAAGICGQQDRYWRVASRDQVRALARAGHEIGCHTARHVNVQSLRAGALAAECDLNSALLTEITGRPPRNFCYPFGDVGLRQKRLLGERFATCRTIYEHHNTGWVDPALIGAFGLFDSVLNRCRLEALVRAAVAQRGWLVFYTHDVAAEPTVMGTSPRLLGEALEVLAEHGVPVMTMADAARHHGLTAD